VERARTLPAQRVLLVLDACYAGTALRLSDAVRPDTRQDQVVKILVAGTERHPDLPPQTPVGGTIQARACARE